MHSLYAWDPACWAPVLAATVVSRKLPPAACMRCKDVNEYVGIEHLTASGEYYCRACKLNPYR